MTGSLETLSIRPKAYSYLRFSTPEQTRGDSFRRQAQLAARYAELHGLDLDEELTFRDVGVSAFRGRNARIGKLGEFLEAVEVGLVKQGSYLLVESLDRISRDKARRALRVLEDICDAGITVVTLLDGREYTKDSLDDDPIALLLSLVYFMRANEESETKSRRLSAAWENKRAKAYESKLPMTARIPSWLKLDKITNKFEVDEARADVVRRIFQLYVDGEGQHGIAKRLNAENVPRFGKGQYWHRSYIVKLLSNPAVIGILVPHTFAYEGDKKVRKAQEPILDYYPAIISHETWDRATALRMGTKAPLRGRHANNELKNLFGGLARCPLCDSSMIRVNKGNAKKGGKIKLVCSKAKAGAGCKYVSVPYEELEKAFYDNKDYLLETIPAGDSGEDIDSQLDQIEDVLAAMDDALGNLFDYVEKVSNPAPGLNERIRELEGLIENEKEKQRELLERKALIMGRLVEHKAGDLKAMIELDTKDLRLINALMRQLMTKIVIDYRKGEMCFHWLHGGVSEIMYAWIEY